MRRRTRKRNHKLRKRKGRFSKRNRNKYGGNKIAVPAPPSYDTNKDVTQANLTKLTELSQTAKTNAAYDSTVNGTHQQVKQIYDAQHKMYN